MAEPTVPSAGSTASPQLVLASTSPSRRQLLAASGVRARTLSPGVDEDALTASLDQPDARTLTAALAAAKARAGAELLAADPSRRSSQDRPVFVLGCDSMLEFDGQCLGKPIEPAVAIDRWKQMRGRSGVLWTGHHLIADSAERSAAVGTAIDFAQVSDAEIEAYVATGEPLHVAGAFTIDSLGGPFIEGIRGDPHNVVGLSVATLRRMLAEFGVRWTDLWGAPDPH